MSHVHLNTKQCTNCKKEKPIDQFHKYHKGKNGLFSQCKPCNRARANAWSKTHNTTEEYKAKRREAQKRYYKNHPEKVLAHRLARQYAGLKESCELCSSITRLHMHHPDYNEPLYVVTVCDSCHKKIHNGEI